MKQIIIFTAIFIFLPGCIGTMDSVHIVKGDLPETENCKVTIIDRETLKERVENVSGKFSFHIYASGPSPSKVDIYAFCNDMKVYEKLKVNVRKVNTIEIIKKNALN